MSLTGIGLDSSCSGGSFLGKKNSSSCRERDFQSGSSKLSWANSKCSSGSVPGLGFISGASILFDIVRFARRRYGKGLSPSSTPSTQMSTSPAKLLHFTGRTSNGVAPHPPPPLVTPNAPLLKIVPLFSHIPVVHF